MENNIQLKNNQKINKDLKNMNNIDIKELYDLYKNEFIISCESILIENQNEFLDKYQEDDYQESEIEEILDDDIPKKDNIKDVTFTSNVECVIENQIYIHRK